MLPLIVGPLQCCPSFWNDLCPFIVLSTPTYPSDQPNLLSRPPWPSQIPLSKPHIHLSFFQCLYVSDYLINVFFHRDHRLILLSILVQNLAYTCSIVDYGAGTCGGMTCD